jgi:glycerol-3-phosphate acyltransferase PlsY
MLAPIALVLLAYLIGSIPFGYLLVRAGRGLDVRRYGSHSIGTINVCRVGGRWLGLATLTADVGKALGVVVLIAACVGSPAAIAAGALAVMLGHAYSLWLLVWERRFSEGKAVACALGVLVGLAGIGVLRWWLAAVPVLLWLAALLAPRIATGRWPCISPATMLAAASLPLVMWSAHPGEPYLLLSLGMTALILVRHQNNIKRLLAGTEPRLGDALPRRARPAAPCETPANAERSLPPRGIWLRDASPSGHPRRPSCC